MARATSGDRLDRRTLNRTLLARQLLLQRRRTPIPAVIRDLVGLQAQEPRDPYVALWARIESFDAAKLSAMLERRQAVRMTYLRGTLHLVTADDAVATRSSLQPAIESIVGGSSPLRKVWDDVDRDELASFLTAELEREPRTRAALVRAIAERWPDRDAYALGYAMYLLPTVQVTPRGLWGASGRSAFTTLERWIGAPPAPRRDPASFVQRYLKAFGPASVGDAQTWSRLPSLREVLEGLRPELRTFRDEDGRELFDVPRAPLADPDTPARVRFLPEYDNVFLSHKERSRIVADVTSVWTGVGWGILLLDGFVAGRWKLPKGSEALQVEAFRRVSRAERAEILDEGAAVLRFLAPDASSPDVRLVPAGRG